MWWLFNDKLISDLDYAFNKKSVVYCLLADLLCVHEGWMVTVFVLSLCVGGSNILFFVSCNLIVKEFIKTSNNQTAG